MNGRPRVAGEMGGSSDRFPRSNTGASSCGSVSQPPHPSPRLDVLLPQSQHLNDPPLLSGLILTTGLRQWGGDDNSSWGISNDLQFDVRCRGEVNT